MIRAATLHDIPKLQVIRGAVRENVLSNPALVTLADYEAHIVGHGRSWVAEVDGEIVGFSAADGERATIWALFVDPAHEAHGHGRPLLDTAPSRSSVASQEVFHPVGWDAAQAHALLSALPDLAAWDPRAGAGLVACRASAVSGPRRARRR